MGYSSYLSCSAFKTSYSTEEVAEKWKSFADALVTSNKLRVLCGGSSSDKESIPPLPLDYPLTVREGIADLDMDEDEYEGKHYYVNYLAYFISIIISSDSRPCIVSVIGEDGERWGWKISKGKIIDLFVDTDFKEGNTSYLSDNILFETLV